MKALSVMLLTIGFIASVSGAQAAETSSQPAKAPAAVSKTKDGICPRGGWDGNNLRISVAHTKLLSAAQK